MINLNAIKEETVQSASSNFKVFNGGKAGTAENVTIQVNQPEVDGVRQNPPKYEIIVTDENGGTVNRAYYVFSPADGWDDEKIKKAETRYGADLVNLVKITAGENTEIPPYTSNEDMLDKVMGIVKANSNGKKFRVGVCYGFKESPKRWLQIKLDTPNSPWIESMDTPVSDSRVGLWDIMAIERAPEADTNADVNDPLSNIGGNPSTNSTDLPF